MHPGENLVVVHEELGGDPSKISVLTRTGQKVCGHVSEDDPIPVELWKPNSDSSSQSPQLPKFHMLVLLALGISKGIVVLDLLKEVVI